VVFATGFKAFTLGTLTGLVAGDVGAPVFSNLAPAPSNGTNQFWTMALSFPTSNFTTGKTVRFTVGRGQQHSAAVGTFASPQGGAPFAGPNSGATTSDPSADLLGGGVLIPEGTVTPNGMAFSGLVSDGTTDFPFSGTINNKLGSGYSPSEGYGLVNAEAMVVTPVSGPAAVNITGAGSRKNHAGPGNLDTNLPLSGPTIGVESRSGGATGDFTMVFKFSTPIASVGSAMLIDGFGSVVDFTISGNEVSVNLTGVTNAQRVTVALIDVADNASGKSHEFVATMGILLGDVNGDGIVNSADIALAKSRSGQAVGAGNFPTDINEDGLINSVDIAQTKARSGTGLP